MGGLPPSQASGQQAGGGTSGEEPPPLLSHEKGLRRQTAHSCGSPARGSREEAEGPGFCEQRDWIERCGGLRDEEGSGQVEDAVEATSEGMRGSGEEVEGDGMDTGRDRRYREVSAVQQRVAQEARRAGMRQASSESARGARKATSKKLRQQTAKSGKW